MLLKKSGFEKVQKMYASGGLQPETPEKNLSFAVSMLTDFAQYDYGQNISADEAKNLLQQVIADYQSDAFTIDDCDSYSEALSRYRRSSTMPY